MESLVQDRNKLKMGIMYYYFPLTLLSGRKLDLKSFFFNQNHLLPSEIETMIIKIFTLYIILLCFFLFII